MAGLAGVTACKPLAYRSPLKDNGMTAPAAPDLSDLLISWKLSLEGARKSDQTIGSYTLGARLYLDWCHENGHPPVLERRQVQRWVVELMSSGRSPATARARLSALGRVKQPARPNPKGRHASRTALFHPNTLHQNDRAKR
jgi:hypothetical protein